MICGHCGVEHAAWADDEWIYHNDTTGNVPHCVGDKNRRIAELEAQVAEAHERITADERNLECVGEINEDLTRQLAERDVELTAWRSGRLVIDFDGTLTGESVPMYVLGTTKRNSHPTAYRMNPCEIGDAVAELVAEEVTP